MPLLGANEENAIVEKSEKQLPYLVVAAEAAAAAAVKMLGARFVINQCAVRSHKPKKQDQNILWPCLRAKNRRFRVQRVVI